MLKTQRGPWKIDPTFDDEELHVRPRGDTVWHILTAACCCRPERQTARLCDGQYATDVVVHFHRPFDGREVPPPRV